MAIQTDLREHLCRIYLHQLHYGVCDVFLDICVRRTRVLFTYPCREQYKEVCFVPHYIRSQRIFSAKVTRVWLHNQGKLRLVIA